MAPQKDKDDEGPPGAGTVFVYRGTATPDEWDQLPTTAPRLLPSPDALLERGIADYTYIPKREGGLLGRGKFSTVYKVRSGAKEFALKHTPLYPHHPLIAARLLREPTLLAHLPPHPCLIGVDGFVRTDGHFYLVAYILDQLVSVVRDNLHAGRVCHRDLKGDNVLVDVATGNILLLDLGLGTHFSMSEPKLTTCCGSPAFHSPEIVSALAHRPGEVTYYGPEVDIWCIALLMLALLLQTRFPLGPTHRSLHAMGERAAECLLMLDELYPPGEPWRGLGPGRGYELTDEQRVDEELAWVRVRRAMHTFVNLDSIQRMEAFARYDVGGRVRARLADFARVRAAHRSFKTTTFIPSEIKYTLPLYLEPPDSNDDSEPLVFRNPAHESERRVLSYIKYLLRCAGILYHHVPDSRPPLLQLVLPLSPPPPPNAPRAAHAKLPQNDSWVTQFLGLGRKEPLRSNSVPPPNVRKEPAPTPQADMRGKRTWAQEVWMRIDVERTGHGSHPSSRAVSRAPSRAASRPHSRTHSRAPSRVPSRGHGSQAGSRNPSVTRSGPSSRKTSGSQGHGMDNEPLAPALEAPGLPALAPLTEDHVAKLHRPRPAPLLRANTQPVNGVPGKGNVTSAPAHQLHHYHNGRAVRGTAQPLPDPNLDARQPLSSPTGSPPSMEQPRRRATSVSIAALAHAPRVTLTLTEPRGYSVIRAALGSAVPPPYTERRAHGAGMPPPTPPTRALDIPNVSSGSEPNSPAVRQRRAGAHVGDDLGNDDDDEPERGRARSRDTPPTRDERSTTVKPGTTAGSSGAKVTQARPVGASLGVGGSPNSTTTYTGSGSGHNTPRPSKPRPRPTRAPPAVQTGRDDGHGHGAPAARKPPPNPHPHGGHTEHREYMGSSGSSSNGTRSGRTSTASGATSSRRGSSSGSGVTSMTSGMSVLNFTSTDGLGAADVIAPQRPAYRRSSSVPGVVMPAVVPVERPQLNMMGPH